MRFELDQYNRNATEDELIADLKRVASIFGGTVTAREQDKHGRFSANTFLRKFGSWLNACTKAGLKMRQTLPNTPEDELFKNLEELWIALGRRPRYSEVTKHPEKGKPISKFSVGTYEKRFGGWRKALESFVRYIKTEEESAPPDVEAKELEVDLKATSRGTRHINRRLLMQVLMRDGFTCKLCGDSRRTNSMFEYHIDHIRPWTKDGPTVLENLQVLCTKCNLLKGDLDLTDSQTK